MDPNPKQFFHALSFQFVLLSMVRKKLSCLGILMICPAVGRYVLSVPCLAYQKICNYQSTSILLAFLIDPIYTPIKSVDLHSGTGSKPSWCFCLTLLCLTLFVWNPFRYLDPGFLVNTDPYPVSDDQKMENFQLKINSKSQKLQHIYS